MRTERPKARISIDPGVSGTGVAVWDEPVWSRFFPPALTCNLPTYKGKDWNAKAQIVGDEIDRFLSEYRVVMVYVEWPEFMPGSLKGNAAAVKGDLQKLTYSVGVIGRVCHAHSVGLEVIPVSVWKGQLSKAVVKERIRRRYADIGVELCASSHAIDAVGIGLHAKGFPI